MFNKFSSGWAYNFRISQPFHLIISDIYRKQECAKLCKNIQIFAKIMIYHICFLKRAFIFLFRSRNELNKEDKCPCLSVFFQNKGMELIAVSNCRLVPSLNQKDLSLAIISYHFTYCYVRSNLRGIVF